MKYLLLPFLAIYLQFSELTWANESSPYCIYNSTLMVNIKVNKTREVKLQKPWYKKLSKPATTVEYYEEEEQVPKLITERRCCEGYTMSALQLCEPMCSEGCPEHSECVEPEICKCKSGYFSSLSQHDRKHYCEPICAEPCAEHSMCVGPNECACHAGYRLTDDGRCKPHCPSGCPFGGLCIEPNYCSCTMDYRAQNGTCVPRCYLGDNCKHGECVGVNKCQCHFGYSLNSYTQKCELNLAIFQESDSTEASFEYTTEIITDMNFDLSTSEADADHNTQSYESIESSTYESYHKCPDDFVLYRGNCQPLKFALDEIDCRLEPCADPHTHCTENGTCACNDGYRWFKKAVFSDSKGPKHHVVKPICLTLEEYKASTMHLLEEKVANAKKDLTENEDSNANEDSDEYKDSDEENNSNESTDSTEKESPNESRDSNKSDNSSNFAPIFFIVLGVLVMTSALVYLGLKLVRTERVQPDVEGKQLSCAYVNRAGTDAEKTVI